MTKTQFVRGLATVALLKTSYDEGLDHVGMFYPFVADVARRLACEDFDVSDIQAALVKTHGLQVPQHTLRILLRRGVKKKHMRREGGRYFKLEGIQKERDIGKALSEVEEQHEELADAFIAFALECDFSLSDREDALATLTAFFAENHISILLSDEAGSNNLEALIASRDRSLRIAARFISENLGRRTKINDYLKRLLQGFVLQNALLLRDIANTKRQFRSLTVYLDSRCILSAIGLEGKPRELATREGLDLLRIAGARLSVFESTLEEIRRILALYEHRIGTKAGRDSLFQTLLARHILSNRYSPADVREAAALLEVNMRQLGISIKDFPERQRMFTLNEKNLTLRLKRPHETELEPRIVHDVDCIAAIMTLRAGQQFDSYDDARAVFCTTNSLLIKTVADWLREQEETGVLPIIHQIRLTNLAWLKKPAAAVALKIHELASLCLAALQPSHQTWSRFVEHLRSLEERGQVSSDETVAILVSEFTDKCLGELEDRDEEIDSDSLSEVVERVRATYRSEAEKEIAIARKSAEKSEEDKRQLELQLLGKIEYIASKVSWLIFWALSIIVVTGLALSLPGMLGRLASWMRLLGYILVGIVTLIAIANLTKGLFLAGLRRKIENAIRIWLTKRFTGLKKGSDKYM